ncbi:hypothetical protein GCM10012275_39290 [Longimycelium tulufanense]|uniref:Uncharacterized protein n=1 Tax=Longimycelium tulufanense TaxID=907463 RepID=A0A8J3FV43_9PSEU|nr:hypothetical protein [Longimycelium tulufanense]GGM64897.1 hypothetical protein GCM10012275_39290 [Longimycelium tulufanense]
MPIQPMDDAVPGEIAKAAEYNKAVSNIRDLDTRLSNLEGRESPLGDTAITAPFDEAMFGDRLSYCPRREALWTTELNNGGLAIVAAFASPRKVDVSQLRFWVEGPASGVSLFQVAAYRGDPKNLTRFSTHQEPKLPTTQGLKTLHFPRQTINVGEILACYWRLVANGSAHMASLPRHFANQGRVSAGFFGIWARHRPGTQFTSPPDHLNLETDLALAAERFWFALA